MATNRLLYTLLSLLVLMLFLAVSVTAVQVLSNSNKKYYGLADTAVITGSVDIENNERLPIRNLTISITSGSSSARNCTFNLTGGKKTKCANFTTISVKNVKGFGQWMGMYGYGYGFGPGGWATANQTFYTGYTGAGYRFNASYTNFNGEVLYNMTLNISAWNAAGGIEGTYGINFYAYAAENQSINYRLYSTSATPNQMTIDGTEPSSSATFSPPFSYGNITVTFTANDPLSGVNKTALWYRFNDGSWTDSTLTQEGASGSFNFEPSDGDGNYSFHTIATDNAQNSEAAKSNAESYTMYDTVLPVSNITALPPVYTGGAIEIYYDSADNYSGIRNVTLYYKWNSGSWLRYDFNTDVSGMFNFTPASDGNYSFLTKAADYAGNVELKTTADANTTYDSLPPASSLNSPAYVKSGNIMVSFSATDGNGTGVNFTILGYKFNAFNWTPANLSETGNSGSFNFATTKDGDGNYSFITISVDFVGHFDYPQNGPVTTVYDTVKPNSTASSALYDTAGNISVSYSAADGIGSGVKNATLWYKFNTGSWKNANLTKTGGSGTFNFNPKDSDGNYSFYSKAIDKAGNVEAAPGSADSVTMYDTSVPTSTIRFNRSIDFRRNGNMTINYSSTDALSGVKNVTLYYRIGGGAWTATNRSNISFGFFAFDAVGEGRYYLMVKATDRAGNVQSQASNVTTFYDATRPSSSTSSADYDNSGNISVSCTANDGSGSGLKNITLWYGFNGGSWNSTHQTRVSAGTFNFQPNDGNGNYSFHTIATDIAGNVETAPGTADSTTIYDTAAPTSAATSSQYATNGNMSVAFTSSDSTSGIQNVSLYYQKNSGSWTLTNFSLSSSGTFAFDATGEGNYSFYTRARDNAGNTELKSDADNLTMYDATKPVSSAVANSSLVLSGNISVNYTASDAGSGVKNLTLYYSTNNGATWVSSGLVKTALIGMFSFSPPVLAATNYTFYTRAKDKAGNLEPIPGSPDTYAYYDAVAPSPTLTSPSDIVTSSTATLTWTTDESATCRYGTTSDVAFANISNATETKWQTTHSWSLSGLADGVQHYYIRCRDIYNHTALTDFDASFSVEISSETRHSTGAGAAGAAASTGASVSHSWLLLPAGATGNMKITNSNIAVTEIEFKVNKAASNPKISVKGLSIKPDSIPVAPKNVYQYIEVATTDLDDVADARIGFKLPLSWFAENNVQHSGVALYRWVDDQWVELPTTISKNEGGFVYLQATSQGFSYFAVAPKSSQPEAASLEPAKELPSSVMVVTPPAAPASAPPSGEPVRKIVVQAANTARWLVICVVILTAALFVLSYEFFKARTVPKLEKQALKYIERSRAVGRSDQEVRHALRRANWPEHRIEHLFKKK